MDEEEIIPRSKELYDADSFWEMLNIMNKQPWLRHCEEPLKSLWRECDQHQKLLVNELLGRFLVPDQDNEAEATSALRTKIVDDWGLLTANTRIVAIADQSEVSGAAHVLDALKVKMANSGWNQRHFYPNIETSVSSLRNKYAVVLVDDFIGSGKKVSTYVKKYRKLLDDKGVSGISLYVASWAAMEASKDTLDKLDISYYAYWWQKKGITDYAKDDSEKDEKIDLIKRLENSALGKKAGPYYLSQHSLGYMQTEALFCIRNKNVPNNVFPVFWWPIDGSKNNRISLFTRAIKNKV